MRKILNHLIFGAAWTGMALTMTSCGGMIDAFLGIEDNTVVDTTLVTEPVLDAADQTAYTLKEIPVNRDGQDAGTVTLRFYEDMPNVPYISVADYHHLMLPGTTFTVTLIGTGQYDLANAEGTATVDTRAETLTSPDYEAFTNTMSLAQPGMPNVQYDGTPFVRFADVTYEPASVPVTFDYGSCGIDLRGDGSSVFFPLATINDFYDNVEMYHVAFNGEKIVTVIDPYRADITMLDSTFFTPLARETRPADMAEFNYRNLCFSLEHYYGYPGRTAFSENMRHVGFDQALSDLGEAGKRLRTLLCSTNTYEYLSGLFLAGILLYDGGHTSFNYGGGVTDNAFLGSFNQVFSAEYQEFMLACPEYSNVFNALMALTDKKNDLCQLRIDKYGEGVSYVKHGNTALCVFNSFVLTNMDQWKAYYAGTGPKPTIEDCPDDPFVILLDALDKAEADPEVENFILDISTNTGGTSDIVVTITSLLTGENYLLGEQPLMGRRLSSRYDIDRNFDGQFDDADKSVKYHLNFAILESDISFSCGNLLPSLLKDLGVLIIGKTSGGGSCCVEMMSTADGYSYQISSHHMRLINAAFESIDKGVTPHVAIADYPDFYNIEKLSQIVNDWYKK